MVAPDRNNSAISYAMQEPSLRAMAPSSLYKAGPLRPHFLAANDMHEYVQNVGQQYEKQGGAENESGSEMVKRDKPFPELKPKNANEIKSEFFNRAWMQEQRRAMMARFEEQSHTEPIQNRRLQPILER